MSLLLEVMRRAEEARRDAPDALVETPPPADRPEQALTLTPLDPSPTTAAVTPDAPPVAPPSCATERRPPLPRQPLHKAHRIRPWLPAVALNATLIITGAAGLLRLQTDWQEKRHAPRPMPISAPASAPAPTVPTPVPDPALLAAEHIPPRVSPAPAPLASPQPEQALDPQDAPTLAATLNGRVLAKPSGPPGPMAGLDVPAPQTGNDALRTPDQAPPDGLRLAGQGRWNEARSAFAHAATLSPEQPDLIYNLAVSLDHLGHDGLAAEHYRRALALARHAGGNFDPQDAQSRLDTLHAPPP